MILIPALLIAVVGIQLAVSIKRPPGAEHGRNVGHRSMPAPATRTAGLWLFVLAVLGALGGLAQINPVWLYGPYNPAQVSAGSGPDWYLAFVDGSSRLFPSWEIRLWGHDVPPCSGRPSHCQVF